jgi:uncharacterized protein (TIGR00255 family)
MPCSMTGFARQERQCPWGTLVWEVRSVNHRYLEPHFRIPDSLRELEPQLRDAMRKQLSRGKVEASFHLQLNNVSDEENSSLDVNMPLVQQLTQAIEKVELQMATSSAVSALDILAWPGVIAERQLDKDALLEEALSLFNLALSNLIEHRLREGEELKSLIEQRLQGVNEQVTLVRGKLPGILQAQRERLQEKLESVKAELDQDRLEQEMVILAQKADVDEELDRLNTHVTEVERTLKQKGSIGRRLDFLMQELNREANTLSSKSIVSDTTQAAVELKVLIEQMREQVQNIE